jgi:hypothetical protein
MMQKKVFFAFLICMSTVHTVSSTPRYLGIGGLFEQPKVLMFELDSLGNFAAIEKIDIPTPETGDVEVSNTGRLVFIPSGIFATPKPSSILHITPSTQRTMEPLPGVTNIDQSTISPDQRRVILERWVSDGVNIETYRIEPNDAITSTGYYLHYTIDNPGPNRISISKRSDVVLGSRREGLVFIFRLHSDGRLEDTGERIDVAPYSGTSIIDLEMARNGAFAVAADIVRAALVEIDSEGNVAYNDNYIEDDYPRYHTLENVEITNSSRYVIIAFAGGDGGGSVRSYRVERDFSLTPVDFVPIYNTPMELAITPDDNFVLVQHLCELAYHQRLTSIRLNHNGTFGVPVIQLTTLDYLSDMEFIPPQVAGAYAVTEEGEEQLPYMETFADWQGGSVPGVFDVPESWVMPDGSLALRPTSSTNCFGFWQSPVDALMVVPYSVYRARYVISASAAEPLDPERLPGLRLRANAQTLQQADTLVLNSTANGFLMTESNPTTFTLLFEPPISSCSREEEMDDVFCSLDLMAFNAEDDLATTYVLKQMLVDRLPVECFDVVEVVRDYEFSANAETWTYGGAPGVFAMPQCSHVPGALLISAAGKTNCFGFWNSDPADAVTTSGEALYRATFYVRTNQPDRWRVPTFRLRLGTSMSELITTHEISSANDSEMSPYYDSADPAYQFEYPVYLYKPETKEPLNLLLAFDLLNFDETDDANTLLILDRVRLERLSLPTFPLDD